MMGSLKWPRWSSNSAPRDGITKISDSVYKLSEPIRPVEVEVVFIHGLQLFDYKEAYWETWMGGEKGKEVCWPKAWLGEDLSGARIWSLSYDSCARKTNTSGRMDAYLVGESLVQEMVDCGKIGQQNCPVVFACHSLGGLVVKEIVIQAHRKFQNKPEYKKLLQSIRGFFFYGTPHNGSRLGDLASYVWSKGEMVELLRVINSELGRLNAEFECLERDHFAKQWQFSVVAETHKTAWGGFSAMVVEDASARHVYQNVISVSGDHFGVCKPESKVSTSYLRLKGFVEEVVEENNIRSDYLLELPSVLVGMGDRLVEARRKLKSHCLVGLVGMGGIGKTTLSKHLFNRERKNFERCCFLEDVKSLGVRASQKQLFVDLCGEQWNESYNVKAHLAKIQRCIMMKKVLLVVDDPGEETDLKSLLVNDFKAGTKGSKVIVTTRRRDILLSLLDNVEGILDVGLLDDEQALELFSSYAFGAVDYVVRVELDGLAKDISKACGGLPLSLEVMGQFLKKYNRPPCVERRHRVWNEALEKLQEAKSLDGSADDRLWKRLKISYDDLDEDHQSMFLDFACIMCEVYKLYDQGFEKAFLERIWGNSIGVDNLTERSLLKWSDDQKTLTMHDQLRDMGRRIERESVDAKKVRIWEADEGVKCTLVKNRWVSLEGVLLCGGKVSDDDMRRIEMTKVKGVKQFGKLSILISNESQLPAVGYYIQSCSETLTWLCLSDARITEWCIEELGSFKKLRVLQMTDCTELVELPMDIGSLSVLRELDLSGCSSLKCLPESIGDLEALQRLGLVGCEGLEGLPPSIGQLSLLGECDLSGCSSLKCLPKSIGDMKALQKLGLIACEDLEELPPSIGQLSLLGELDLSGCSSLKCLPESIGDLEALQRLRLVGCEGLEGLPPSIGQLSLLGECDLSGCSSLKCLPKSIGDLKALQKLGLGGCEGLEELPPSIGQLSLLGEFDLSDCCSLKCLPERMGDLKALQKLGLIACEDLEELPPSIGQLSLLGELDLSGCSSLKCLPESIGDLEALQRLRLVGCEGLEGLPPSIGQLSLLGEFDLSGCCSLKCLPERMGDLKALQKLELGGCEGLEELPPSIGQLSLLGEFDLSDCCSLKCLPERMGDLKALQKLELGGCEGLEELPPSIGQLSLLGELVLLLCISLKCLPKSIGDLKALQRLGLGGCEGLEELPPSIGQLSLLGQFDLSGCSSLKCLPESIGDLKALRKLGLRGCEGLEELPTSIGQLSLLEEFDLSGCSSLKCLPKSMGDLKALQKLGLGGCDGLEELPPSIAHLSLLGDCDLSGLFTLKYCWD